MKVSPEDQRPENDDLGPPPNDVQEDSGSDSGAEQVMQRQVVTSATKGARTSTTSLRRTRRGRTENMRLASPTSSRSRPVQGSERGPIVEEDKPQQVLANGVRFTALYAFDVFKSPIKNMKSPLSWFLYIFMVAWLLSRLTPVIQMAFSPLCIFPGISKSTLCLPVKPFPSVNFAELVNIQGSAFEQLVGQSAGGSELSTNVLKAEMATQDLSIVVRYSDLKSKDDIADMLRTIAADAKKTGRGLSKLDAKVIGAIDEVMALNNYAMVTIDGADRKAPSWLLQTISPISLGATAEDIIAEAYTLAMDESERAIRKLILEAEASWQNLEQLDADISTLHEIITRENIHTNIERRELLGKLWMMSNRNKRAVQDFDDRLALLNDLGKYREQAAARVKDTLRALNTMTDDLEVLRERVATPGLLGSKIPIHVQMESIRSGLERLQENRMASRGRGIGDEAAKVLLKGGLN